MKIMQSINPADNSVIQEYNQHDIKQVQKIILNSFNVQKKWRSETVEFRINRLRPIIDDLKKNINSYAEIITFEMGKPILESIAEIKKCILLCEYYFENGEDFLKSENLIFESKKSLIRFEPLGIIFGIMPWNFPFWQVFRFAIPSLISGNTVLLKHASNVQGTSILIDKIFNQNIINKNIFQSLIVDSSAVSDIISNKHISAISFTGSDIAGSKVAECCGYNIKKTVLELGGSDPFIVLEDADIEKCIDGAVTSRMINNGQSCIAAKRFIINDKIHNQFLIKLKSKVEKLIIGNPMDKKTQVGPLATKNILDELDKQIQESKKMGASIITGGRQVNNQGCFYYPTIITDISKDMPVYYQETFGPIFTIIKVKDDNEAIRVANDSQYGLGGSVWSTDEDKAFNIATQIETGCVFINGFTRSDPKLPFGGIKKSGYGKELSKYGIREFVNSKTIVIY